MPWFYIKQAPKCPVINTRGMRTFLLWSNRWVDATLNATFKLVLRPPPHRGTLSARDSSATTGRQKAA